MFYWIAYCLNRNEIYLLKGEASNFFWGKKKVLGFEVYNHFINFYYDCLKESQFLSLDSPMVTAFLKVILNGHKKCTFAIF